MFWQRFFDISILDKCHNKDGSCEKFGGDANKDIFCSIPWSVLNCPKICTKSCAVVPLGRDSYYESYGPPAAAIDECEEIKVRSMTTTKKGIYRLT